MSKEKYCKQPTKAMIHAFKLPTSRVVVTFPPHVLVSLRSLSLEEADEAEEAEADSDRNMTFSLLQRICLDNPVRAFSVEGAGVAGPTGIPRNSPSLPPGKANS